MSFSNRDLHQIEERGITPEKVEQQIDIFKRGNITVTISEAATVKNGILQISEEEGEQLISFYNREKDRLNILKFVPASGAATRMFKPFYSFLKEYDPAREELDAYLDRKNDAQLELFMSRYKDLPFYEEVLEKAQDLHPDFSELSEEEQKYLFTQIMLEERGLNLGDQPKGLIPFHKYEDHVASAFEEHLWEAVDYASYQDKVRIHFTIAEEHREKFEAEARRITPRLESETGMSFEITYSYQDPKTDTIAVTIEDEPFRDEKGDLFFRPGGHGALIENLNEQEADIIFIKNIDNVVVPKNRKLHSHCKEMLAGKLLELQEKIFTCLEKLDDEVSKNDLDEIIDFLRNQLNAGLRVNFEELATAEKISVLRRKLNKPLRICGMVKNEGEPGGGPFWISHKDGSVSLQIIESSQIDHENYQQSKIAQEATHFNPVDVVCSIKDYRGWKFDLREFVDEEACFISKKNKDGKELKALELPGLWNGAMANWNTIFVEVPVETFNPVKTVTDLLKPSHQVK